MSEKSLRTFEEVPPLPERSTCARVGVGQVGMTLLIIAANFCPTQSGRQALGAASLPAAAAEGAAASAAAVSPRVVTSCGVTKFNCKLAAGLDAPLGPARLGSDESASSIALTSANGAGRAQRSRDRRHHCTFPAVMTAAAPEPAAAWRRARCRALAGDGRASSSLT